MSDDPPTWVQHDESSLLRPGSHATVTRDWAVMAALVAVSVSGLFWVAVGELGLLIGLLAVGVWAIFGGPAGIATAGVLVAAAAPTGLAALVATGLGLLVLVVGPLLLTRDRVWATVVTLALGIALCGGTLLAQTVLPLWVVSGLLLVVLAPSAYLSYRHHLLTLGLLGDSGSRQSDRTDPDEYANA